MNALEQVLNFAARLRDDKIHFTLGCSRDAIMVIVPSPSRYFEIEFFADGRIESQEFGPAGDVKDVSLEGIIRDVGTAVNGA
jgi:hypothetical protein